jgi:hypothetical protein
VDTEHDPGNAPLFWFLKSIMGSTIRVRPERKMAATDPLIAARRAWKREPR